MDVFYSVQCWPAEQLSGLFLPTQKPQCDSYMFSTYSPHLPGNLTVAGVDWDRKGT